jgi:prepilin-type N-terminal cleavage/methylation domain-containing protein/prepilin-type processing-associated H-X9-DG protein
MADIAPRRFTLIEMLVVIAIIAILASLLLPALGDAKRRANQLNCMQHLKQIQMAVIMYADNWDGQLPAPDQNSGLGLGFSFEWYKQLNNLATGYGTGGGSEVTICLEAKFTYTAGPYRTYGWNNGGNSNAMHIRLGKIAKPAERICLGEARQSVGVPGWGDPIFYPASALSRVDFRHVNGGANFAFFDGHVQRMGLGEATAGARWSYP